MKQASQVLNRLGPDVRTHPLSVEALQGRCRTGFPAAFRPSVLEPVARRCQIVEFPRICRPWRVSRRELRISLARAGSPESTAWTPTARASRLVWNIGQSTSHPQRIYAKDHLDWTVPRGTEPDRWSWPSGTPEWEAALLPPCETDPAARCSRGLFSLARQPAGDVVPAARA